MPDPVAKLEAKWQEREAEKLRRREAAAAVSDPAENAHAFWQVRVEGAGGSMSHFAYLAVASRHSRICSPSSQQTFNEGKRRAMDKVEAAESDAQTSTESQDQPPSGSSATYKLFAVFCQQALNN